MTPCDPPPQIIKTSQSVAELYPRESIVYLSPDAGEPLEEIDPKKIYVIGGLVDGSPKNRVTINKAAELGVEARRLPIAEYMSRIDQFGATKILTLNQVYDILISVTASGDWEKALGGSVPKRKGFRVKDDLPDEATNGTDLEPAGEVTVVGETGIEEEEALTDNGTDQLKQQTDRRASPGKADPIGDTGEEKGEIPEAARERSEVQQEVNDEQWD